jgi:predicted branched-subunit amino acid permease
MLKPSVVRDPGVGPGPQPGPGQGLDQRRPDVLLMACGLAWLAGLIHIQAAIDHFDEYVPYAILFIALASAQLVWGVAFYRWPTRRLLYAGMAGCLAVILAWISSRTIGLPFGPDLGHPEPVGVLDLVATVDEVAIVALCVSMLQSWRPSAPRSLGAIGLFLIVVSALVLAGGLHAH